MRILLAFVILIALVGCACPSQDSCFLLYNPYVDEVLPICIKKGSFSKSEEDRGFKIFESFEEMKKYLSDVRKDGFDL